MRCTRCSCKGRFCAAAASPALTSQAQQPGRRADRPLIAPVFFQFRVSLGRSEIGDAKRGRSVQMGPSVLGGVSIVVAACGHVHEGGRRWATRTRCPRTDAVARQRIVHMSTGRRAPCALCPVAASICVRPWWHRRNSAARAALSSSAACTSVTPERACTALRGVPSRNCLFASGRLASLSSGVIASSGGNTPLDASGLFGSGLSVANRHGRWKFRNGAEVPRQVLKRAAWRCGMHVAELLAHHGAVLGLSQAVVVAVPRRLQVNSRCAALSSMRPPRG